MENAAFDEPARRALRANWLPFLKHCVAEWPTTTDSPTVIAAFRALLERVPRVSDVERSELEELQQRQPESDDAQRLLSLVCFVCNFVWLRDDNPFESDSSSEDERERGDSADDEETGSVSGTASGSHDEENSRDETTSLSDDDDAGAEDDRLFFIKEIVLCRNTLNPLKKFLAKPMQRLFERECGLTEDNLHLFRNLLRQNVEYLESASSVTDATAAPLVVEDTTPLKRRKVA